MPSIDFLKADLASVKALLVSAEKVGDPVGKLQMSHRRKKIENKIAELEKQKGKTMKKESIKTTPVVMQGIGIFHPNGSVELEYLHCKRWRTKMHKGFVSREVWRKAYRPDCIMKRVKVIIIDA